MAPKDHKEGCVIKLQILLANSDVHEPHSNLEILLAELNLNELDFTVAADIKMGKFHYNNLVIS